jgi:hypothetical protein
MPEDDNSRGFATGRHPKKFSYTYQDLADLFNMTVGAVRKAVHDARLDPENLQSVYEFLKQRNEEQPTTTEETPTGSVTPVHVDVQDAKFAGGPGTAAKFAGDRTTVPTGDHSAGGGANVVPGTLPAGVLCPACGEVMAETWGLQQYHCGPCNRSWGGTVTKMQDIARDVWRKKHE